jgi:hypothetical protein
MRGAARRVGRALRPWPGLPRALDVAGDPYLFYTATLTPIVLGVAVLAQRPGEPALAVALSVAAISVQLVLGRTRPARLVRNAIAWPTVRLAVPLLYVGASVQLIGGPALPLLALFVPVVVGAAAIGRVQGWITAGLTALVYLLPELGDLGSSVAVVLRGVTLAGVSIVLAYATRRMLAALETALREARTAAVAARRRSRQIDALEAVGRLLAGAGPSAELLGRVLDMVVRRFGYQHVSIYLGDEQRVELVAQRGYV